VPGSDVFASRMAGSVPLVSAVIGGRKVPDAPASPPLNATPLVGTALLEAKVEKSVRMGIAVLEQLP
jgi:hypothetical protein